MIDHSKEPQPNEHPAFLRHPKYVSAFHFLRQCVNSGAIGESELQDITDVVHHQQSVAGVAYFDDSPKAIAILDESVEIIKRWLNRAHPTLNPRLDDFMHKFCSSDEKHHR